jgi:hypothetical protein
MLAATFRPLTQWPGKKTPTYNRKRAPFKAGYPRTLDDLEREINHLSGKSVVIQAEFETRDIRNDGWPRSSARAKGPGVVVSFQTPQGPLSFPCDTYDAWEDNLRAIALSLEALRAVNRYGVTKHSEQYKGFAQIEAPGAQNGMDRQQAVVFVRNWGGAEGSLSDAYRRAARVLHPDASTGSHEQFVKLQQAKAVLCELA